MKQNKMRKNNDKKKYFFLDSQKWQLPSINSQSSFNYTQVMHHKKIVPNPFMQKNKSNITTQRTQKNPLAKIMEEFTKKKIKIIAKSRKRYEKDEGREFSDQKFHSQQKYTIRMKKRLLKNNIASSIKNSIPISNSNNKQTVNTVIPNQSIIQYTEEKTQSIKQIKLEDVEDQFYVSKFKQFINQNNKQISTSKNNYIKNTAISRNEISKIQLKPIISTNGLKNCKAQKSALVNAWEESENTSKHSIIDYTENFSNNRIEQFRI